MLLNENYNPYQAIDFYASDDFHSFLKQYAATAGDDVSEDGSTSKTFNRQIDGWLLSAAFGAGDFILTEPLEEVKQAVKVISGQVLKGNISAISFLANLAIGLTGDVEIVKDPRKVVKIAGICAELGYNRLKDAMNTGSLVPPAVTLATYLTEAADDL